MCYSYGYFPKLSKLDGEVSDNPSLYRSVISLQFLTLSRPDIAYSVNKSAHFLQNPTTLHRGACKRLLRYLKGSVSLGLEFTLASTFVLEGFVDADWVSFPGDRRSTGGHCMYPGGNLVSWHAKKEEVVLRSSA